VLRLHDTPWLNETWSANDIVLLGHNLSPSDQPYISRTFSSIQPITQASIKKHRIIKNTTIFAFGVASLEIFHSKRLKTFETPYDLEEQGKRTMWTDYFIADRLVGDIHKRELPNFANVTRRCVHCNFDGTVYSLDDDDFRERFNQGVIVPLQQDYDYAMMPVPG